MPRLRYSAESKEDLKQVATYIAQDKPVAARQWVAEIKEKCRLLASQPDIGDDRAELGGGVRRSCVGSENHSLHRMNSEGAILHASFVPNRYAIGVFERSSFQKVQTKIKH